MERIKSNPPIRNTVAYQSKTKKNAHTPKPIIHLSKINKIRNWTKTKTHASGERGRKRKCHKREWEKVQMSRKPKEDDKKNNYSKNEVKSIGEMAKAVKMNKKNGTRYKWTIEWNNQLQYVLECFVHPLVRRCVLFRIFNRIAMQKTYPIRNLFFITRRGFVFV